MCAFSSSHSSPSKRSNRFNNNIKRFCRIIYIEIHTCSMYISDIHDVYTKSNITLHEKPMSDIQHYFAYFSLYILFPMLYNILVSGNQSLIMVLWRYINSVVFDAVTHIQEVLFYGILRAFGQYNFSTYTVVKNGREIYTASSMFFYYKSFNLVFFLLQ